MTQCEKIVEYINEFGSISTMEAFSDLGITRLASRIHDLQSQGMAIEREIVKGKNRYGETVHFMRYSFPKEK
jgi:hypothetical protein